MEKIEELEELRTKLKSGEYGGVEIMQAWLTIDRAIDQLKKLEAIKALLKETPFSCLCGHFESCEICNPYSGQNKLRDQILNIIEPKKPMTVEDYGKVVVLEKDLLKENGIVFIELDSPPKGYAKVVQVDIEALEVGDWR